MVDPQITRLAEDLIDRYGASAMDDRLRLVEWLEGHGMAYDDTTVDTLERQIRWLVEE